MTEIFAEERGRRQKIATISVFSQAQFTRCNFLDFSWACKCRLGFSPKPFSFYKIFPSQWSAVPLMRGKTKSRINSSLRFSQTNIHPCPRWYFPFAFLVQLSSLTEMLSSSPIFSTVEHSSLGDLVTAGVNKKPLVEPYQLRIQPRQIVWQTESGVAHYLNKRIVLIET